MKNNLYKALKKLVFTFIVLATFAVTVLILWKLSVNYKLIKDTQFYRMETLNRLATSKIQEYVDLIDLSLNSADYWISSQQDKDPRTDRDFIGFVNMLEMETGNSLDIRMIGRNGTLYHTLDDMDLPFTDVSDRNYFTIQLNEETKGFYISHPIKSRLIGNWLIPVSIPVTSDKSEIRVLFAALSLSSVEDMLKVYNFNPSGAVYLIKEDGTILATSSGEEKNIGKSISEEKIWEKIKTGKYHNKIIDGLDFEASDSYLVYNKIDDYGLYVVSTASKNAVLDLWYDTAIYNGVLIFMMFCCAISIGVVLKKVFSKLEHALSEIEKISNTDHLTCLNNRRAFTQKLEDEIQRSKRYGNQFALAMIDIDYFKRVNDSFGHDVGDRVLVKLSEAFRVHTRTTDTVGRWGGEEFAILLLNSTAEQAYAKMDELRQIIADIEIENVGTITCSIGVTSFRKEDTPDSLFARADQKLYLSKQRGRNRVT